MPAQAQSLIQTVPADVETDWHKRGFWETLDGQPPPEETWEFVDQEVRLIQPKGGKNSLVSVQALPAHFELSWQWKIEAKTNSGLKYRVRKFGSSYLGVEYQIIDEKPGSGSKGSTASIYDLVGPDSSKPLKPAGEWNRARVKVNGHRLEHFLNDVLVTSMTVAGPVWDSIHGKSKFGQHKSFAKPADDDRIMLTDHGGKIAFKNFQFVALPAPKDEKLPEASAPFLANACRNGWADQNSIVIWTRTTAHAQMNVDGKKFVSVSASDAKKLAKESNGKKLLSSQLPDGAILDDMFGACPGAAGEVRLTYFPAMQRKQIKSTDWITTDQKDDFTAQWKLEKLAAGKRYVALVEAREIGGNEVTSVVRGGFVTPPASKKRQEVKFCVTTCHDFIRRDDGLNGHKIYPAMTALHPHFVVHAGDIEYYDKPDPWAWTVPLMRFKWGRIFALPSNRDFYKKTTSYFIKDDHDTLKNDCWVGQTYGNVTFERGVKLFNEEQFPSHSPRYKTVSWGKDVQIWILEGRDFRSPNDMPDGPDKSILGKVQKAWLFETLDQSKATFKLVFTPTPIVGPDRARKKDNHANEIFQHEGRELRTEFAKHKNLIVFCGDRHWQYASVDPDTGLWEFGCGPGSEKHQLGWKPGDKRPEHQFLRVAGGFLSGEVSVKGSEPTLTIRHHQVSGKGVSEFRFPQVWQDSKIEQSKQK